MIVRRVAAAASLMMMKMIERRLAQVGRVVQVMIIVVCLGLKRMLVAVKITTSKELTRTMVKILSMLVGDKNRGGKSDRGFK